MARKRQTHPKGETPKDETDVSAANETAVTEPPSSPQSKPAAQPRRRSLAWRVQPMEDRDGYAYEIKEALEKGVIPDAVREESNWIGEGDSAEGDVIIAYIRTILDRLSHATHNAPHPPIHIVLSDQNGINTGVIPSASPPILIVGLGLLDMIEEHGFGEDHLAAVLSHERFHLLRHQKWENLKNGRPEETLADIFSVVETNKAGYNPSAATALFKEWSKRDEYIDRPQTLSRLFDEHPADADRVRNTELALANIQLSQRMTSGQTDIPPAVFEASGNARYQSYYDQFKTRVGFDEQSSKQQLKLIHTYVMNVLQTSIIKEKYNRKTREFPKHLCGIRIALPLLDMIAIAEREQDRFAPMFRPHWRGLMCRSKGSDRKTRRKEYDKATHYAWLTQVYTRILDFADLQGEKREAHEFTQMLSPTSRSLYSSININLKPEGHHQTHSDLVPPVYRMLERRSEAFWTAETVQDALRIIVQYQQADRLLKRYENGLSDLSIYSTRAQWPDRREIRVSLEKNGFYRLPWENVIQAVTAQDTNANDREAIVTFARSLGCNDPRITGENMVHKKAYEDALDFQDLQFDDKGNVIALKPSEKERMQIFVRRLRKDSAAALILSEEQFIADREKADNEAVENTDWSRMETEFEWFVADHIAHLEPCYSILPARYPFAEAFMERLDRLVQSDPQKWQDLRVEFITGTNPNKKNRPKKDPEYGDESPKAMIGSLPDLLQKAAEKYFEYSTLYGDFDRAFRGKRGDLPQGHALNGFLQSLPDTRTPETRYVLDPKTGTHKHVLQPPAKVPPAQHSVQIDFFIDGNHPFAKALIATPKAQLGYMRKNHMMTHFRHRDLNAATLDGVEVLKLKHVFNFAALNTPQSFHKVARKIHDERVAGREATMWNKGGDEIELLKTLRSLDRAKKPKRFSFHGFSTFDITTEFNWLRNKPLAESLRKEMATLVERQVRRNARIDLAAKTPLPSLIERYKQGRGENESRYSSHSNGYSAFFTRPKMEQRYVRSILKRITALNPEQRLEPLSDFMSLQIKDPAYRKQAIEMWVDAQARKLGLDDGTPAYTEAALKQIKRAGWGMESSQALSCSIALLDKVEAQESLAFKTKDMLINKFGADALSSDLKMRTVESAVETCATHPAMRTAFLKYITEPLTKAGTQAFAKTVKTYGHQRYSSQHSFVKQFFDPEKRFELPPAQERMVVDYLHKNFWDSPFELRTVYLDRILFPTNVRDDDKSAEDAFQQAVTYVLDKVLPIERPFAKEAREALIVYLEQCPKELRRTTFSAILATTQENDNNSGNNNGGGEMRPGQVLSYVLARTGAAGGQLLQAGHSYLGGLDLRDPALQQFRDDLKDSKVNFDRPLRWQIFERMNAVLPSEEKSAIARVGAVLGSGSTAYVVACDYAPEQVGEKQPRHTALKVMRENVRDVADLHFERYGAAFDVLASRHDVYKPLPSMVAHAKDMIHVSTRGEIAAAQVQYAQDLYNPLAITVEGQKFTFDVAAPIRHGAAYLETARIDGDHLNDYPDATHDQAAAKRRLAIAIETAELYRMMQGKAIDQDRHGGQQKVVDGTIGIFDVGAIAYDADENHPSGGQVHLPTNEEKTALGAVIGRALNAAENGQSPVEAFVNAVIAHEDGACKHYLVGVKRGLLARTDAHSAFGTTASERAETHAAIFQSIWQSGQIDPHIAQGIASTLSVSALGKMVVGQTASRLQKAFAFASTTKAAQTPMITIEDSAAPLTATPDFGALARDYAAKAAREGLDKAVAQAQAASSGTQGASNRQSLRRYYAGSASSPAPQDHPVMKIIRRARKP